MPSIERLYTLVAAAAISLCLMVEGSAQGRPDITWMRGGHSFGVMNAEYSPDGSLIASVADDGTLKIWRSSDFLLLRTVRAHPLYARALAWSPDSQFVATGAESEERVKLWRASDGSLVWNISANRLSPGGLSFSPDGQRLAISAGSNGPGFVVRVADGMLELELSTPAQAFGSSDVKYSPDGRFIATNTVGNTRIVLLHSATGAVAYDFGFGNGVFGRTAFSNDGQYLAVANSLGVKVFRMSDKGLAFAAGQGHFAGNFVAFSPDSQKLVVSGDNLPINGRVPMVWLWQVGPQVGSWPLIRSFTLPDNPAEVGAITGVSFTRDSGQLLTAANSIALWDASTGLYTVDVSAHAAKTSATGFTPDGATFVSAGNECLRDRNIRLWRASDGALLRTIDGAGAVPSFAIAPDGSSMVALSVACSNGGFVPSLIRWRLSDGARLWTQSAGWNLTGTGILAFLPDGQTFLAGTGSGIDVRRVSDGAVITSMSITALQGLAVTPDGQNILTRDSGEPLLPNAVNLRRVSDGGLVRTFAPGTTAMALSQDGGAVATASSTTRIISVWSLSDGQLLQNLEGHTSTVDTLAFAPDGDTLTSGAGGADASVRIWDIDDDILLKTYDEETGIGAVGHYGPLSIGISPDGSKFGFGRGDATVVMANYPYAPPARTTPLLTWATPASITYGTPLSAAQLNATASVAGTFVYTPAGGAVLEGGTKTLGVLFTPSDLVTYTTATASVSLAVLRATPTVQVTGGIFAYDGAAHPATSNVTGVGGAVLSPLTVTYNGSTTTPFLSGAYSVVASFTGSANYLPTSASATLTITDHLIDGSSNPVWQRTQWPSRHLAVFPDGKILLETSNNRTLPLLDPLTGAGSLFPGLGGSDVSGVAPNPIVWANGSTGYLIGGWGSPTVFRQDGVLHWKWENVFGCCNNTGLPYMAVDRWGGRLMASLGTGLYMLPLASGPPAVSSVGGQASGLIAATTTTAYVAGTSRHVSKWNIAGQTPSLEWSKELSAGFDTWNFSEGAITGNGSFVVTRSGNHSSIYWAGGDIWRAGDLYWISADGLSTWTAAALATTPPVIGRTGLIYVGALAAPGAPQSQLDGVGIIRAYDQSGQIVWTAPTNGVPQDLFVGDDGNVYALAGGAVQGRILVLDQTSGALRMVIDHLPKPWEILLRDGVVYVAGDSGVVAVRLPQGFAVNYDPQSPWPIRQHDNQRTSQQLASTTLTAAPSAAPFGGSATLSASLVSSVGPVSGRTITFSMFGVVVGAATTNASGTASFGPVSVAGYAAGTYGSAIGASFAGDSSFSPSSSVAALTVIDSTPPVITVTVTGVPGANGWYKSNISIMWTVSDAESTITSTVGCGAASVTADTAGVTFTCSAVSAGGPATRSVTLKRDATPPSIGIVLPAAGGLLGLGQAAVAEYACSDSMSGVVACAGPVANGAPVDTSVAGNPTFTVTAADDAGNTAERTVRYSIVTPSPAPSFLYVPNRISRTLSVIDTLTNRAVATIPVGPIPINVVLSRDGRRAYVANLDANYVSVIDTTTNTNIGSWTVGNGPWGLAVSPDGARLYVANLFAKTVTAVNVATGQTVASVGTVGHVRGISLTPDGRYLFAADATAGVVEVIETAGHTIVAVIPVGGEPQQAAITPDGTAVYVPTFSGIAVIETARIAACPAGGMCPQAVLTNLVRVPEGAPSGQPVTIVPMPDVPTTIAFTADGARAYLTHSTPGGLLTALDTRTYALSVPVFLDYYPYGVAVGVNGPRVYVGKGGGDAVYVLDTGGNSVLVEAGVGSQPALMAVSPVAAALFAQAATGDPGASMNLSATLTFNGGPVTGRTVTFMLQGAPVGSAITGTDGVAMLSNVPVGTIPSGTYATGISVRFAGDGFYLPANATSLLTIRSSTPLITWADPALIVYGTPLGATQLNATANVPGTFAYTPNVGTVLDAGFHQTLSVVFTPNDSIHFSTAPDAVQIDVAKGPATLSLGNLNQIADGAPKAVTVTTNPAGLTGVTVTYEGTPVNPGSYFVTASLHNLNYDAHNVSAYLSLAAPTPPGNTGATSFDLVYATVTVDLPNVAQSGSTYVTPISPSTAGSTPGGFLISGASFAVDVTTTATITAPNSKFLLCFTLSSISDPAKFRSPYPLRILHREAVVIGGVPQYQLVDRTVLKGVNAPNAVTKTICAETTSLSPFVVAEALDFAAPAMAGITLSQNPAPVGTDVILSAVVDDSLSGNTSIALAEYSVDGGLNWQSFGTDYYATVVAPVTVTLNLPVGVYALCVRGTDAAQNSATVCTEMLAVYDANGGFVTGGGWIMSPAGAYSVDPAVTGRATFGFVSRYQHGASVPSGDTQFKFQAAGFSFKSADYEWLVIAGKKAQYKGTGTINGAGLYGFMLTAIDGSGSGSADTIRIKIWQVNSDGSQGPIIYDNQRGDSDTKDSTTALGGGEIIIHKP